MFVVTQLYFQIVEENDYMFRPFSGWAVIRLRLEYRRKLIYYNVDIKNVGTRSRFTTVGEVRSYVYRMWNLCWLRLYLSYCHLGRENVWFGRQVNVKGKFHPRTGHEGPEGE
jgi:hypothetical protein